MESSISLCNITHFSAHGMKFGSCDSPNPPESDLTKEITFQKDSGNFGVFAYQCMTRQSPRLLHSKKKLIYQLSLSPPFYSTNSCNAIAGCIYVPFAMKKARALAMATLVCSDTIIALRSL